MTQLAATLAAIDAANSADPDLREGAPAARLYGERMTVELDRMFPDAPDTLRIAARGQHIERWTSPRSDYPEGKQGYLDWRRDLAAFHAARIGTIMSEHGYDENAIAQVGRMIRKEGIKREPLVQDFEDVICFTFLRWYFEPFAAGRDQSQLMKIVEKTARKMSQAARQRVLAEFSLPDALASFFRE